MADTPIHERIAAKNRTRVRKGRFVPVLAFFVFACAMAALIAGSGYLGAQSGQSEVQARQTTTASARIVESFRRGQEFIAAGNFVLAQAHLEEVLRLQPGNNGARSLLATVTIAQRPTPTIAPTVVIVDIGLTLRQAQTAFDNNDWDTAIALAEQLAKTQPDYERARVTQLHYDALIARGAERLRGEEDQIEGGLFDLDLAAEIQALPDSLEGERRAASAYVEAVRYFGVDWNEAIARLSQLPASYRDVGRRLIDAYVLAGDAYANLEDWCPAASKYADGLKVASSPRLEAKRSAAAQKCASATPSGGGTIGSGIPLTGVTAYPVAGAAGRIAFSLYDAASGIYRPYTYDAAAASVSGLGSEFGVPGAYAPDGARTVQSIFQDGVWQLLVRNATDTISLTQGRIPVWGPSGYIAYQGCSDACGIHIINPDQPGSARRMTGSANDSALAWSPQGDRIVYMSNAGGPWEVYSVGTGGDVRQLTTFGASSGAPAWSPDGTQIAFLSNRDGAFALFVMNADGANLRKAADFGTAIPAWQSDHIVWTR